jgi:peptide/nickel transport system ATP-binding protein
MSGQTALLELKKVKKHFILKRGVSLKALEDISFTIYEGEKFGVVGESGCGKSTLGRVILQLYPATSGACIYYGVPPEALAPRYLQQEIEKLPVYQQKAGEYYKRSLDLDRQASALEQAGSTSPDTLAKAGKLRERSKENRKEASRQLREGSRTAGSLILSQDLPRIQELFQQSHREMTLAHEALAARARLADAAGKTDAAEQQKAEEKMKAFTGTAQKHMESAKELRRQAFEFRGRNIAPITERCQDAAYQKKLDGNYETGINLGKLTTHEMRMLRRDLQMIFQDPAASLDPRQSVGRAIEEVFAINTDLGPETRQEKTMALLEQVGLKREHYYSYPHALSGGQKQRVGIARAIALDPKFVVLDESVSALDVSVQAQILELLNDLSRQKHLTYLFITHDLGVVKYFCDRILVMYLGHICELADSNALFHHPQHPYTASLLSSVPRPVVREGGEEEQVILGEVPSALNPPKGCPFHTRCPKCTDLCREQKPPLLETEPGHYTACFFCGASSQITSEEA